jgi:hypothetical protein
VIKPHPQKAPPNAVNLKASLNIGAWRMTAPSLCIVSLLLSRSWISGSLGAREMAGSRLAEDRPARAVRDIFSGRTFRSHISGNYRERP